MNSNYIVPADAAPAVILNDIKAARAAFGLSKDSAAKAAAYTYIVWRQSRGPHALPEAKAHVEKAIEDHNAGVDAKAKEMGFVKIKAREGASDFTVIVKYVLNFVRSTDSSNVSRYAKALQWLHSRFGNVALTGADELVDAINEAGGFEAIQKNVKAKSTAQEAGADAALKDEERSVIKAFLQHKALAALNSKPVMATLPAVAAQGDSWRLLVGRATDQGIEIVEQVQTTPADLYALVGERMLETSASVDPSSLFVSRVLALGELVECGVSSALTLNSNPHGDKLKSERVLSLRTVADKSVELVFSAKHADASTVIIARPTSKALNQSASVQPVYLPSNYIEVAREMLTGPTRSLVCFEAEVNPLRKDGTPALSPLAWQLINEALKHNEDAGLMRRLYWSRLSEAEYLPVDVEQAKFTASAQLDAVTASNACADLLKDYAKAKAGAEPVTITVSGGQLTVQASSSGSIVLAPAKGSLSLKMRGKDLHNLLNVLGELKVATVALSLDSGGLVRVQWSEDCGSFEVNIPTLNAKNEPESRRFAPMVIDMVSNAAAA